MSENYWVIETLPANNTSEIVVFLNDQINKLKEMTSGKVIAVFEPRRISQLENITAQVADGLAKVSAAQDASTLYNRKQYEYYITDKKKQYELAVFTLFLNEEYPAKMLIDNGLMKEAAIKQESITINQFSEFLEIYKKIIQSHKVTYVIRKLNEM